MLDNDLFSMSCDAHSNLQYTSSPSFGMAYKQAGQAVQKPSINLDTALQSDNNDSPFPSELQPVPIPVHDVFATKLIASPHVRRMMRQMAWEKAQRVHTSRADPFLSRATQKALLDAF